MDEMWTGAYREDHRKPKQWGCHIRVCMGLLWYKIRTQISEEQREINWNKLNWSLVYSFIVSLRNFSRFRRVSPCSHPRRGETRRNRLKWVKSRQFWGSNGIRTSAIPVRCSVSTKRRPCRLNFLNKFFKVYLVSDEVCTAQENLGITVVSAGRGLGIILRLFNSLSILNWQTSHSKLKCSGIRNYLTTIFPNCQLRQLSEIKVVRKEVTVTTIFHCNRDIIQWIQQMHTLHGLRSAVCVVCVWYSVSVRCSTNWGMKPHWKQVKCEFNLYPLYMKRMTWCILW